MRFEEVSTDSCMHEVAMQVSDVMREQFRELYMGMYRRHQELENGMPNVVLAGLTVLWLECVHSIQGTLDYESAIALMRDLRPRSPKLEQEMKQAARDFLRRSRWLAKRSKK